MRSAPRLLIVLAALTGCAGVAMGAFGAHALRDTLAPASLALWQTGVMYLFWHVLAALFALRNTADEKRPTATLAASLFLTGVVLFSGSLFAVALGAPRGFGAITPVGGVALIAGWIALAVDAYRRR